MAFERIVFRQNTATGVKLRVAWHPNSSRKYRVYRIGKLFFSHDVAKQFGLEERHRLRLYQGQGEDFGSIAIVRTGPFDEMGRRVYRNIDSARAQLLISIPTSRLGLTVTDGTVDCDYSITEDTLLVRVPQQYLEKKNGHGTLYDPPSGWKYGFPKPYQPLEGESLRETLLRDGYPEHEIANGGDKYVRFIGGAPKEL